MAAYRFTQVINVHEHDAIRCAFPTVKSPNPEEPAALDLAIRKAKEVDADIVLASDPDADRMGIAIKNDKGEWILVNGNQNALLFTHYLISQYKATGRIEEGAYMVKTIVTTELMKKIADRNGIECFDVYTGFKWIAAIMREFEGKRQYIGGGEESYGFLVEDFVRDKDAVSACAMMAEIAAWAKDNGKTMYELLQDIYVEYGFSKEKGISVVRKGKSGAEEIEAMMKNAREQPITEIAGSKFVLAKDYATLVAHDFVAGEKLTLDMPTTSNVLQYFTEDGTKVSIRPSGTEPKIKFYIEVSGELPSRADYDKAVIAAEEKIKAVAASLGV